MALMATIGRLIAPVLMMLHAGAVPAAEAVREYVDERTAVSVTYTATPLVFAREHPSLGVNVREYLSLAPLELNRGGRETYYLFGYLWHTGAVSAESLEALGKELVLLGEDRRIRLQAPGKTLREAGLSAPPWPPPVPGAHPVIFVADAETLRYLAFTTALAVDLPVAGTDPTLDLWRDGRDGLREFLSATVD